MRVEGATALAPQRNTMPGDVNSPAGVRPALEIPATVPSRRLARAAGGQTSLFSGDVTPNVIPFESFQRPVPRLAIETAVPRDKNMPPAPKQPSTGRPAIRRQSEGRASTDAQGSLALEVLQPAPHAPRTLKTTVEASIYCDAPVAAPMHRSVAAILDAAMVLIGFGMFIAIFQLLGGKIHIDRFNGIIFLCASFLITSSYSLLFALCRRETAGQNWTELRLINFDGMRPDAASRALRFVGGWLSIGACGVGVLWALLDEENLTWHDHMSKTFLTMRETESTFFRERAR